MFTTIADSVRPHQGVEYWADLVSRNINPMRIEPVGELPFRAQLRARTIGDLKTAEMTITGIRALHTRGQVARTRSHLYAACVNLDGDARINRRGEQIELRKGDIFITDSRQEFTLDFERPSRQLTASLPTSWIDSRVTRPELLGGMVLRDHPLGRLWASHLSTGFTIASTFSPTAAALFARHSVELLSQAVEEVHSYRPTASPAARAAIYLRACHVIALKCSDPKLGPDQIARELGLSTRSLVRIFAAHNDTIMRRVFDERIGHAATLLDAPEAAHRTITEIAFACGFNDASHFGRTFAAARHMTPSQWRRRSS